MHQKYKQDFRVLARDIAHELNEIDIDQVDGGASCESVTTATYSQREGADVKVEVRCKYD